MKQCISCKIRKPISSFYRNSHMRDLHLNYCKSCIPKNNNGWKYLQSKSKKYGLSIRAIRDLGFKKSLFVYDRANRQCEKCGQLNDLTIHHKDGNGRNLTNDGLKANNDLENLMVLCRSCHGYLHGKLNKIHGKKPGRPRKEE